jgi:hypothetical protein
MKAAFTPATDRTNTSRPASPSSDPHRWSLLLSADYLKASPPVLRPHPAGPQSEALPSGTTGDTPAAMQTSLGRNPCVGAHQQGAHAKSLGASTANRRPAKAAQRAVSDLDQSVPAVTDHSTIAHHLTTVQQFKPSTRPAEELISLGNRLPVLTCGVVKFMGCSRDTPRGVLTGPLWKRSGRLVQRHVGVLVSAHPTCKVHVRAPWPGRCRCREV